MLFNFLSIFSSILLTSSAAPADEAVIAKKLFLTEDVESTLSEEDEVIAFGDLEEDFFSDLDQEEIVE